MINRLFRHYVMGFYTQQELEDKGYELVSLDITKGIMRMKRKDKFTLFYKESNDYWINVGDGI